MGEGSTSLSLILNPLVKFPVLVQDAEGGREAMVFSGSLVCHHEGPLPPPTALK